MHCFTGALSFTIYNSTKATLHSPAPEGYGWTRERIQMVALSGAIGGSLAGCVISFGSTRTDALLIDLPKI